MSFITSLPSISITHQAYGWSKWGGGNHGLVTQEDNVWYCQICGEKQVDPLPSYFMPFDSTQRDFGRVCSKCKAKATKEHIVIFWDLYQIVKK